MLRRQGGRITTRVLALPATLVFAPTEHVRTAEGAKGCKEFIVSLPLRALRYSRTRASGSLFHPRWRVARAYGRQV
jgi:hypothetical protein